MSSAPTVVLVPGAGGDPWYWHRVVDVLAERGIEGKAVDIPGDQESADLPEYVDAVVAAAGDRAGVVVVGQSLGAFSAVLACSRLDVSRLVMVNAMIPAPHETPGQWWSNTGHGEAKAALDRAAGRDPDAEFDVFAYFLHDLPPDVLAASEQHARQQADRPFGTAADFDAWPGVPTHVIIGRDDRFFPAAFQQRLAVERAGVTGDEIPGGHLVALSQPGALVDLLAGYLSE